jgi:hypothetical protein
MSIVSRQRGLVPSFLAGRGIVSRTLYGNGLVDDNSFDPDALAYIEAVEAADGEALEDGVKNAINNFVVKQKETASANAGVTQWEAIKSSAIMMGARTLAGMLVPLRGDAPTNFNFVNADYDRVIGLKGNGSTKYLLANRDNSTDPQDNHHVAVYLTEHDTNTAASAGYVGPAAGVNDTKLIAKSNLDNYFVRSLTGGVPASPASSKRIGFLGLSRTISASFQYIMTSTEATFTGASIAPIVSPFYVFRRLSVYTTSRMSFYSIGEAIDLTAMETDLITLNQEIHDALMGAFSDTDVLAYVQAVETADAEYLNYSVAQAVNTLVTSLKATDSPNAGVSQWEAIKALSVFAGAHSLTGALVPLKGATVTNSNFVSGDYNRIGLLGDDTSKQINSNRANNADPQNNKSIFVYVTTPHSAIGQSLIGSGEGAGSGNTQLFMSDPDTLIRVNYLSSSSQPSVRAVGLYGASRNNGANVDYVFASGTVTNVAATSTTPTSNSIYYFSRGSTSYSNAGLSVCGVGEAVDLGLLKTTLDAFQTQMAGITL